MTKRSVQIFVKERSCILLNRESKGILYSLCRHLVYATVERGQVLDSNGVTAIGHRKSGSQY